MPADNTLLQTLDRRPSGAGIRMIADRFQLGTLIGEGDFAQVYYALDSLTGDTVSVKCFDRHRRNFSQRKIMQEFDVLQRLQSAHGFSHLPNVIGMYETSLGEEDCGDEFADCVFLISDFIPGVDLQQKLTQVPNLEISDVLRWFVQIVIAVEECHNKGVFHRDIKPANIILNEKKSLVKLIDFGTAILAADADSSMIPAQSCGSPAITPPEIASGSNREVDGKAIDVWGLGVTLFMMLTGRPLYHGSSVFDLYQKISDLSQPVEIPSSVPEDVADLLSQMLCKDPASRISVLGILSHTAVRPYVAVELARIANRVASSLAASNEVSASTCRQEDLLMMQKSSPKSITSNGSGPAGVSSIDFLDCTPAEQLMLGVSARDAQLMETATCTIL